MTYGCIEDLKFAVEVFDQGGNLREVLARLHDLDAARATYGACRVKYPTKLIFLCQGGRILRRSDREVYSWRIRVRTQQFLDLSKQSSTLCDLSSRLLDDAKVTCCGDSRLLDKRGYPDLRCPHSPLCTRDNL